MTLRRAAGPILFGLAALATRADAIGPRPAEASRAPVAIAIGNPASVEITPKDSALIGRRATRQLILTAVDPDGSVRDLTRAIDWASLDPSIAVVSPKGQVTPKANGTATIVARKGSLETKTTVVVSKMEAPAPVSFRLDVVPAFSQASCNMGACHGTPTGKGGFKLSLRGYLPDQDFFTLSRDSAARRINPIAAESSMVLLKPLGEIAHEGGLRLNRSSKSYKFIRDWIAEGAKDDVKPATAIKLEIFPGSRVLNAPAKMQQTYAVAHYSDGTSRDVTPICYYNSSNPEIAEVDSDGYVMFKNRGEVAVIAHYLDLVANVRLTHLVEVPGFKLAEVPKDNVIDKAVFAKLNRMRISPSDPCTDGEFFCFSSRPACCSI